MNGLVLLIIGVACLLCGYLFYGRYLCKQWGVGENKEETPAHTMEDGVDYVPAKAPVLMGHHFSSIAGAGPITGPINAIGFGFGWPAPCGSWLAACFSAAYMTSAPFSPPSATGESQSAKSFPSICPAAQSACLSSSRT